jgi:hypothetical protein
LVKVHPPYKDKREALLFRDEIKKYDEYYDAWIQTNIQKK